MKTITRQQIEQMDTQQIKQLQQYIKRKKRKAIRGIIIGVGIVALSIMLLTNTLNIDNIDDPLPYIFGIFAFIFMIVYKNSDSSSASSDEDDMFVSKAIKGFDGLSPLTTLDPTTRILYGLDDDD